MIDRQLARSVKHFLDPNYRWETIVEWCRQQAQIDVEISDIRGMTEEQLIPYLQDQADRQAEALIQEQIDENLPEHVEDERDRNWQAMARWVNAHFGLNTNDRELKKIGLENMFQYLNDRAKEAMARFDFEPVKVFLAEDWGRRSLAGWIGQQYGIPMTPEMFEGKSEAEAIELIQQTVKDVYRHKEVEFPVSVGLTRFMAEHAGGQKYDREGLVRWANGRFQTRLDPHQVESKPRHEIARMLTECSQQFLDRGAAVNRLEEYLNKAYGPSDDSGNGHSGNGGQGSLALRGPQTANEAALAEMISWANQEFQAGLDDTELSQADRQTARLAVLRGYERRYRPELYQTERALILDVLDTAWKDHLYFMDHLRQGIGLVGYAQKDPKVEYRREGMKAFESMWDRIAGQVTGAIFRIEKQSPEFVGSLWRISATTHEAPPDETPSAQKREQRPWRRTAAANDEGGGADPQLRPESRPQRPVPLRQREEIQEVLRRMTACEFAAL